MPDPTQTPPDAPGEALLGRLAATTGVLHRLVSLAITTREAQQAYFRERTPVALAFAKKCEGELDRMLAELYSAPMQQMLDLGGV
jgi:hypothetical protein